MKRNCTRKVVFGLAMACLVASVACLGVTAWAFATLGGGSVITASLIATTLFLACCGGVLYVMSQPRRPLPPEDGAGGSSPGA